MIGKEKTDEQIIKGLECCGSESVVNCAKCPYAKTESDAYCANKLMQDALALIRRQKKRLLEQMLTADEHCDKCIAEARAEAIREFAKRIKEQSYESNDGSRSVRPLVCDFAIVEEIAGEMTEEQK